MIHKNNARLIYSMPLSLDGYVEDEEGGFGWAAPDEQVHAYINELGASIGTHLYGRRMYETMVYWETAHTLPNQPEVERTWTRQWQQAEKIVYSQSLAAPQFERTRVERVFEPEAIRQLKATTGHDIAIAGPALAAQAFRAGLVDEIQAIICPVIVGGGKRFFPDGLLLQLELLEERRFGNGMVVLRYAVRQ